MIIYLIRIFSGIVSAFIICFPLAWLNTTPKSEQIPGTFYYTFADNFWFPFIIMIFIYLIIAVPYSLYIDNIMNHYIKVKNKLLNLILLAFFYICGGIVAYTLFIILVSRTIDARFFNLEAIYLSSTAGLTYMLAVKIFESIIARISR
jgi:hypothetical protein